MALAGDFTFGTELVSKVTSGLKCGKAPDINRLTAEHLLRAYPIIPLILDKFFHLSLICKLVPTNFDYSYICPTEIECLHFQGSHMRRFQGSL